MKKERAQKIITRRLESRVRRLPILLVIEQGESGGGGGGGRIYPP
jgi:hypothetical protein